MVEEFARKVIEWYKVNKREFPWRVGMSDEWVTALTAILLRKTRAETVAKHYARIVESLSTPQKALQLGIEGIEELLKPLGLHRTRARQIYALAKAWGKEGRLPGLGPYAISLIDCLHKRKPVPIIDVNTARVVSRYFGVEKDEVKDILQRVVEAAGTCEVNLAIMDLAAKICTIRKPKCVKCVLNETCVHLKSLKV